MSLEAQGLLQGIGELVGAGGGFGSASDAFELLYDFFCRLSCHELGYSLQVAVTSADELYRLDFVAVEFHLD